MYICIYIHTYIYREKRFIQKYTIVHVHTQVDIACVSCGWIRSYAAVWCQISSLNCNRICPPRSRCPCEITSTGVSIWSNWNEHIRVAIEGCQWNNEIGIVDDNQAVVIIFMLGYVPCSKQSIQKSNQLMNMRVCDNIITYLRGVHTYIHTYIYTYIHTYIYTYIHTSDGSS